MQNINDKKNIEHFNQEDFQNGCHLVCSSITWVNLFLILFVILVLYYYFK